MGDGPPLEVEDGTTLVVEIGGEYVDAPGPNVLARLAGDTTQPLLGLLGTFTRAARDSRIDTVVLRIEPLGVGWGTADEIRAAAAHKVRAQFRNSAELSRNSAQLF